MLWITIASAQQRNAVVAETGAAMLSECSLGRSYY